MIAYLDADIVPQSFEAQNSRNSFYVASLLAAIARKSPQVETTLRLMDSDLTSTQAAAGILFPRVCKVIVSSCAAGLVTHRSDSWSFFLGGRIFPDLRQLETNGFPRRPTALLPTIEAQLALAEEAVYESKHFESIRTDGSFGGLSYLQALKIEGDVTLNQPLLLYPCSDPPTFRHA